MEHKISMLSLLAPVITFLLGLAARTVAPLLIDRLQFWLAEMVAKRGWAINTKTRLGGKWHHTWYAQGSDKWPQENPCAVRLSAVGRHAAGVYHYHNKNWLVTASVDAERLVTGTWRDLAPNGYSGVWLGRIDYNGEFITGWYLGTTNRGATSVGEWIWWREGTKKPELPAPLVQTAERVTGNAAQINQQLVPEAEQMKRSL